MSSSLLTKAVNFKLYKTVILPVVLYERENCFPTLREKFTRILRLFESWVLRRVFGIKGEDI
jgi:hypothetical protein